MRSRRFVRASFLGILTLSVSFPLCAQADEESSAATQTRAETRWYGWQPLISDVSSMGVLMGAIASRSEAAMLTMGTAGVVSLGVTPPLLHFAHGRPQVALLDFGLRVLVPVVTGSLAFAIAPPSSASSRQCHSDSPFCAGQLRDVLAGSLFVLGGGSLITAIVLDASMLSKEQVPRDSAPRSALSMHPVLALNRGAQLGLVGAF